MKPVLYAAGALLAFASAAYAAKGPEVISAGQAKRNAYVSDTVISGGDAQSDPFNLSNVRWAKNPGGYERLVVDLGGEGQGWDKKAPPYFQVGHDSKQGSFTISIRGIARRDVTNATLTKGLAKSALISKAYLAPSLEGDLAAIEFQVRAPVDLEAFYLTNPPRIVVDVRSKR